MVYKTIRDVMAVRGVDSCRLFVFTLRVCLFSSGISRIVLFTDDMGVFSIELETVYLCTCKEPSLQLLSMGLFPSAPLLPSLAVDLQMLDFAQGLFMNAAPNTTAWCETLEGFLGTRNFKLETRVSG